MMRFVPAIWSRRGNITGRHWRWRRSIRIAGSTLLLGGAIGRIRDALLYCHQAKCAKDATDAAKLARYNGGPRHDANANRYRPAA
jgi:hypothetical protein